MTRNRVLADTSVWIDYLVMGDEDFAESLRLGLVCSHPFVIGELACGRLQNRSAVLGGLRELPSPPVATHDEVLDLIERHGLMGRGIGYVDAHLLASAALGAVRLWTRDQRLGEIAAELGLV